MTEQIKKPVLLKKTSLIIRGNDWHKQFLPFLTILYQFKEPNTNVPQTFPPLSRQLSIEALREEVHHVILVRRGVVTEKSDTHVQFSAY